MKKLRFTLRKLGLFKSILLVTFLAILVSSLFDLFFTLILGFFSFRGIIMAALTPAILAPVLCKIFLGLLCQLDISESRLSESLEEKKMLHRELHHRVKNNMSIISSLINLHITEVADEEMKSLLLKLKSRIMSMAYVHDHLQPNGDNLRADIQEYVKTLLTNLIHTFVCNDTNIRCIVDGKNLCLSIDKLTPLGLIVNELAINSIKYGFSGKKEGVISISIDENGHEYLLDYADDGAGLPPNFDIEMAHSTGFTLVKALTAQLNGKLEVKKTAGAGFSISFPSNN